MASMHLEAMQSDIKVSVCVLFLKSLEVSEIIC